MNLQSMTIIFVIIFLPIILISTYYIQLEVDTISLQASYDTKLIDATTDAVSAFEMNTANEDLSSASDFLRSIIEASNNVFTTTLATNMGMSSASKSKILPYIPAVVYVLYDGYYIYSPTQQPKVLTNSKGVYVKVGDDCVSDDGNHNDDKYIFDSDSDAGDKKPDKDKITNDNNCGKILYYAEDPKGANKAKIKCTTDPDNAYNTTSYILKSFIPYSMQYQTKDKNVNVNVTINYTLDNYITIYGTIGDIYYSKSGYLIDWTKLKSINVNGNTYNLNDFMENYGQNEIDDFVENNEVEITWQYGEKKEENITISTTDATAESLTYTSSSKKVQDTTSAIEYYLKGAVFSKWVEDNLADVIGKNDNCTMTEIEQSGFTVRQNGDILKGNKNKNISNDQIKLFWEYNEKKVFKTKDNGTKEYIWNVDETNSNFYEHKTKVIKNSIQYNLNLAMAVYNAGEGDEYYQMPILTEPEWDKLLSNVSILAFMQGIPCGLKTYNNYALVTSTNNELMTNKEDIYYIPIFNTDTDGVKEITANELTNLDICHNIQCTKLSEEIENSSQMLRYFQSFPSKEIKYDKVWDPYEKKFKYDHVCNKCYDCLVSYNNNEKNEYGNYKTYQKLKKIINRTNAEEKLFEDLNIYETLNNSDLLKAEFIAIGKIRNNTYKQNSLVVNNGLFIEDLTPGRELKSSNDGYSIPNLENCYEIEVTIDKTKESFKGAGDNNYIWLGKERVKYNTEASEPQKLVFNKSELWESDNDGLSVPGYKGPEEYEKQSRKYTLQISDRNNKNGEEVSVKILSIIYKYK